MPDMKKIFQFSPLKLRHAAIKVAAWIREKLTRLQAPARIKENAMEIKPEKPETPAEHLARLKKEHKAQTAEEEKFGILTGDVAQARLARQRAIEHLERETQKK